MPGRKRPASNAASDASVSPERPSKRARQEPNDDEDDLETILARIKEQEESEALARQLQDEWNKESDIIEVGGSSDLKVIDVDGDTHMKNIWSTTKEISRISASISSARGETGSGPSSQQFLSRPAGNEPPDNRLAEFRDIYTADKQCPDCGNTLKSPRGFVTFSPHTPPPSLVTLLHIPCKKCKKNHCRACLSALTCPVACKGPSHNPNCPVTTCCTEIRAIALFELLGGFDRQYIGEKETSSARAEEAAARRSQYTSASVGPGGTGYGADNRSGGGERGRGGFTGMGSKKAQGIADHWDEILVRAFTNITKFLPAPYSESAQAFDFLPHVSIQHLLSLSQLPELLGSLLRNDSVTDWVSRSEVYYAMLALLRRLADCELTVNMLIDQQWEKSKTCGIADWMWVDGEVAWERGKDKHISRAPPLYAHFRKLTKQCAAFLAGASQLMDGDGEGEGEAEEMAIKATSLCGDMIAARDDIERAMKTLGKTDLHVANHEETGLVSPGSKRGKNKGKGRDPAVDMERTYARECEQLAFKHVSLSVPSPTGGLTYPTFQYAPHLTQTASTTRIPKNRFHLVKELAVMATSLPPGVWVRVDEVRNDAIKVMIAGPDGTPYEGGLFEFDCFMPIEYPNTPPLVHLRTTGGGKVRFNPNLYNNGKVCLSLLGTWPGRPEEQWSSKSTLLQVLVSIQSMILIDLPYFNEPGYGAATKNHPQSITYNKNICVQNLKFAMVEWMKDEHKDGLWGDVIASHFSIRGAAIRKTIETWAREQPLIRNYDPAISADPLTGEQYPHAAPKHHAAQTVDLLSQYDEGIQRIRKWRHGEAL